MNNTTYLVDMLVEAADYYDYECKDAQVIEFVSLRMDNREFDQYKTPEEVQVPDTDVDGWVEQFKLWLAA